MKKTLILICICIFAVIYFFFYTVVLQRDSKIRTSNDSHNVEVIEEKTCLNPELYGCITSYISHIEGYFPKEIMNVYYSLFFFQKDYIEYFTVWAFNSPPIYLDIDNKLYDYYCLRILDNDVILVKNHNDSCTELFYNCISESSKLENLQVDEKVTFYDGSWFFQTYSYYTENGKYHIERVSPAMVDFLGDDVPQQWLKDIDE